MKPCSDISIPPFNECCGNDFKRTLILNPKDLYKRIPRKLKKSKVIFQRLVIKEKGVFYIKASKILIQ